MGNVHVYFEHYINHFCTDRLKAGKGKRHSLPFSRPRRPRGGLEV
jgi:hypothetical protein